MYTSPAGGWTSGRGALVPAPACACLALGARQRTAAVAAARALGGLQGWRGASARESACLNLAGAAVIAGLVTWPRRSSRVGARRDACVSARCGYRRVSRSRGGRGLDTLAGGCWLRGGRRSRQRAFRDGHVLAREAGGLVSQRWPRCSPPDALGVGSRRGSAGGAVRRLFPN